MSTESMSSEEQAVTTLFNERQKYEQWISALEARKTSTPAHIFERVLGDYRERLTKVVEQLQTHRTSLEEMAAQLENRITLLDIDAGKLRDERDEIELRMSVGELGSGDAEANLARSNEGIERLTGERELVVAELSRLESLLEGVKRPTPAAAQPAQPAQPQPVASAPKTEPAQPGTPGSNGPGSLPLVPEPAFDEVEFLNSVLESESPMSFGNISPSTPPSSPSMGSTGSSTPDYSSSYSPSRAPVAQASATRDVPPEQVKSLKCQECSTLNYPTEWYCERCGAELAAL